MTCACRAAIWTASCDSGAQWAVDRGYGYAGGPRLHRRARRACAAPIRRWSPIARASAAHAQLGTLGSGNHFAELQYVAEIYDEPVAAAFGLRAGSGDGHDSQRVARAGAPGMRRPSARHDPRRRQYGIELPDRQLCCAPLRSPEGRAYLGAMSAAANFAFANRQVMAHWVRESIADAHGASPPTPTGMRTVYDVCHNIAKFENVSARRRRRLCVHRKGATRAYPPGHPQTPAAYREVGQPVLIPGDMGRYSYVLVGTERAYRDTFGSTCHGAGGAGADRMPSGRPRDRP